MGFEYYKADNGDWRFRLKSTNGKIVAHGEGYVSKRNVLRGIVAVRHAARIAETEEVEE